MFKHLTDVRQQLIDTNSLTDNFASRGPYEWHKLSLEQQKKRAKELKNALQNEDPSAWSRTKHVLAGQALPSPQEVKLHLAQQVVARELGFRNWTDLKNHIGLAKPIRQSNPGKQPVWIPI